MNVNFLPRLTQFQTLIPMDQEATGSRRGIFEISFATNWRQDLSDAYSKGGNQLSLPVVQVLQPHSQWEPDCLIPVRANQSSEDLDVVTLLDNHLCKIEKRVQTCPVLGAE